MNAITVFICGLLKTGLQARQFVLLGVLLILACAPDVQEPTSVSEPAPRVAISADWLNNSLSFLDLDTIDRSERASLVTTGSGRFYSNGLDVAGLSGVAAARSARFLADFHRTLCRLLAFRRPTVAAINGHAFAAGAMLAVAHDFAVMRSDRGFFCLPEVDMATGQPLTPAMYALLQARERRYR